MPTHLGSKGPVTFYQRQLMQLADMTVLVRGNLSKGARTTGMASIIHIVVLAYVTALLLYQWVR